MLLVVPVAFVLVNWAETNSSPFFLKSFVLKHSNLSWCVYNLVVTHSKIGTLRNSLPRAFCPPGNGETGGICANWCLSTLGWGGATDSAGSQGLEMVRPLLLPGDSDGPKNWFLNLPSLKNHLASFKRCWCLSQPQEIWLNWGGTWPWALGCLQSL